ncbi:odorant receptor 59b [Drosophila virilis]|nr:odorant receptor 59b [Drosophila virilis]
MKKIFRLINPAPLTARVRSRECCTYLYRLLKFVGWIPPKENLQRYLYLFWSALVLTFGELYVPLGLALSLVKNFTNFTPGDFLGVLQAFVNANGATSKSIVVIFLYSRLSQMESVLDTMDERLRSESDRRTIHKAVADSNYIFLVYAIVYCCFITSVFVSGVLNGQPPWFLYNPIFDWRSSAINFWMQSILEQIFVTLSVLTVLIWDTYPLIFVFMMRAHIKLLREHILNLRTDPLKTETENYDELTRCIRDHKLILQCCDIMRPVLSGIIFVHFQLVGVLLGVIMINVLYFSDLMHGISSLIYLTAILLESFPCCYLSDLLAEDSTDLLNLLAQSNWINAQRKYKSTLIIFMHHVQQPIVFIAGGLFTISMNSNIKMAKFAFSVMTIVQQMNLGDRLK